MTTALLLLALSACGLAFAFYYRWQQALEWYKESSRMHLELINEVKRYRFVMGLNRGRAVSISRIGVEANQNN